MLTYIVVKLSVADWNTGVSCKAIGGSRFGVSFVSFCSFGSVSRLRRVVSAPLVAIDGRGKGLMVSVIFRCFNTESPGFCKLRYFCVGNGPWLPLQVQHIFEYLKLLLSIRIWFRVDAYFSTYAPSSRPSNADAWFEVKIGSVKLPSSRHAQIWMSAIT